MTPERWLRIKALFDRAVGAPQKERAGLVRASGEPQDIQDEVLSLLQAHEDGAFLEPPSTFADGTRIGDYRIVRLLSQGGMGVVYLAQDINLNRLVALKALPPDLYQDERMRQRLRKEAQTAASLQHPAIATVYKLEEINSHLLIATEYLEGQTLRDDLEQGPLPLEKAVTTALEIAGALVAAHERGIVHRDLKPENVMRLTNGSVKILDFGLARFDPALHDGRTGSYHSESGIMAGTPRYMAPEQLLGQPTSIRTDQFAFGVVLYELILGRHPFGAGSLPSILARVLSGEPDEPGGFDAMPESIWQIVQRCLSRDPADRFATTADLFDALDQAAAALLPLGKRRSLPSPSHTPTPKPQAPSSDALWWWSFHQLAAALVYWTMVWPVWHVHEWLGRGGMFAFFATLAAIIVAGNLRMNLSFTARAYPSELAFQRARVGKWIRLGDYGFAAAMILIGVFIADAHNGWGALFLSMGLGSALVSLAVEPLTARAAFGEQK